MIQRDTKAPGMHGQYTFRGGVEPIDFITSNNLDYLEGVIVKYIYRYPFKGQIEDLQKAKFYLEELITQYERTLYKDVEGTAGVNKVSVDKTFTDKDFRDLKFEQSEKERREEEDKKRKFYADWETYQKQADTRGGEVTWGKDAEAKENQSQSEDPKLTLREQLYERRFLRS